MDKRPNLIRKRPLAVPLVILSAILMVTMMVLIWVDLTARSLIPIIQQLQGQ